MLHDFQGLARRFQLENAFVFADFTDEELLRILSSNLKKSGLVADLETRRTAIQILSKERKKPNFGNAGSLNNLVSVALKRMTERQKAVCNRFPPLFLIVERMVHSCPPRPAPKTTG